MRVTEENMAAVTKWCGGCVPSGTQSIELKVVKPNYGGFGRAHVGDWVVHQHNGFKVYRDKQFRDAFRPLRSTAMKFEDIHRVIREVMSKQDTATYLGNSHDTDGLSREATLRIMRITQ